MLGSIGMPELIVIFVIALVVFGPRRLPELGRSLGRTVNEFKRASASIQETWEREASAEAQKEQTASRAIAPHDQQVAGQVDAGAAGAPTPSEFSEQLSRSASGELG